MGVSPSPSTAATESPSASPTPVVIVSASPSMAAAGLPDGWHAVPDQASIGSFDTVDVVWMGGRFVALAVTADAEGVFLDSPDGVTWHLQEALGTGAGPTRLASGPRGVVAIGALAGRPTSWATADGLTWTARPDAFPASGRGGSTVEVTGAIATTDGWLAVGREDAPCQLNCGLAPVRAWAWISADGLTWRRVPVQPSLEGGGMNAVARTASGFVAVGVASGLAAVWTSSDGRTWLRVPDDPIFHPRPDTDPSAALSLVGVAANCGSVVAAGQAFGVGPGGAPAALGLWSRDGRTWAEATVEDPTPDYIQSVTATADGFLATGSAWHGQWLPIVWSSSDGRAWRIVSSDPGPHPFLPVTVAIAPTVEVAVGGGVSGTPLEGVSSDMWWRTIP